MNYLQDRARIESITRMLGEWTTEAYPNVPVETKEYLRAGIKSLQDLVSYTNSLRAASRSVLLKTNQRGGVPGIMSELGSLTSAYNGTMMVMDGEDL